MRNNIAIVIFLFQILCSLAEIAWKDNSNSCQDYKGQIDKAIGYLNTVLLPKIDYYTNVDKTFYDIFFTKCPDPYVKTILGKIKSLKLADIRCQFTTASQTLASLCKISGVVAYVYVDVTKWNTVNLCRKMDTLGDNAYMKKVVQRNNDALLACVIFHELAHVAGHTLNLGQLVLDYAYDAKKVVEPSFPAKKRARNAANYEWFCHSILLREKGAIVDQFQWEEEFGIDIDWYSVE